MKFLEAVRIENEGKLLGNDGYSNLVYKIINGNLMYKDNKDVFADCPISATEQKANWHIIEPDKPKQKWYRYTCLHDYQIYDYRDVSVFIDKDNFDRFCSKYRGHLKLLRSEEIETSETDIAKIWQLFEEIN
jgi:hypothetical protein